MLAVMALQMSVWASFHMARRKNWVTKWKKKKGVQHSGSKVSDGAPGKKPDEKALLKKAVLE
jgi:hypothetical protein